MLGSLMKRYKGCSGAGCVYVYWVARCKDIDVVVELGAYGGKLDA